jgi:hypothetical protein
MQSAQRVGASFLLASSLAVASCGGGGGGGPPPPPPPPPAAVVAAASVSAASVQEGQPFSVDASASTTNSGSPLTYAWTQIAGPAVTMANPNTAKLDLSAPEVTADAPAQFRVTVNAGALVSQATVNVTFANIAQTPTYNGGAQVLATVNFNIPVRRVFGDGGWGIAGASLTPTDPLTFLDFSTSPTGELQVAPSQLENLSLATVVKRVAPLPGAGTDTHFGILDEAANRFRIMTRTAAGAILPRAGSDFFVQSPCWFSHGFWRGGRAFYVGTRTGFSVFNFAFLPPTPPSFAGSVVSQKPFCAVIAPRVTIHGTEFPDTAPTPAPFTPEFFDVIALDQSRNEFNIYRNSGAISGVANYQQLGQPVPVQLNATKPLQLKGLVEISQLGGIGFNTGMALIFSDGVHAGEHRLVIVGFDANHTLVQQTYNLGLGVPVQVFTDNLDGDTLQPEIVVLKSTSPQVEIYETASTAGGVTPLTGPSFLEIGLGATQAARSLMMNLPGMTVVYPEKKQVKVIDNLP